MRFKDNHHLTNPICHQHLCQVSVCRFHSWRHNEFNPHGTPTSSNSEMRSCMRPFNSMVGPLMLSPCYSNPFGWSIDLIGRLVLETRSQRNRAPASDARSQTRTNLRAAQRRWSNLLRVTEPQEYDSQSKSSQMTKIRETKMNKANIYVWVHHSVVIHNLGIRK